MFVCFCTELEISFKNLTFDFPCSISVHNLSQFSAQDLWRKLIFTLEGVKSRYSGTEWKSDLQLLCVCVRRLLAVPIVCVRFMTHTHQIHLSFLQLCLLLPQFLTMQQLHTEILTERCRRDFFKKTNKTKLDKKY